MLALQRPEYIGMSKANLTWVAWRKGNLPQALEYAQAALELWHSLPIVYPFYAAALWPLIGVTCSQGQFSEAVQYTRDLLAPSQQRLPDALSVILEAAIQAWDAGQPDAACAHLRQAVALAGELGYL